MWVFGTGPENDQTTTYDKIFAMHSPMLRVLTFCLLEVSTV